MLYYCRQNATSSGKDNAFAKFLTTLRSDQESSSTLDSSTHSRVRLFTFTPPSIETVFRGSDELPERSKCMWTYRYNTDVNRIPRTLVEARCSQFYLPGIAGQCEHVYYFVPIKRRIIDSGIWIDDYLWHRVGCTLAIPIKAPPITFD